VNDYDDKIDPEVSEAKRKLFPYRSEFTEDLFANKDAETRFTILRGGSRPALTVGEDFGTAACPHGSRGRRRCQEVRSSPFSASPSGSAGRPACSVRCLNACGWEKSTTRRGSPQPPWRVGTTP
jgi:hypothetical protein